VYAWLGVTWLCPRTRQAERLVFWLCSVRFSRSLLFAFRSVRRSLFASRCSLFAGRFLLFARWWCITPSVALTFHSPWRTLNQQHGPWCDVLCLLRVWFFFSFAWLSLLWVDGGVGHFSKQIFRGPPGNAFVFWHACVLLGPSICLAD
jgi:hypothetical protein